MEQLQPAAHGFASSSRHLPGLQTGRQTHVQAAKHASSSHQCKPAHKKNTHFAHRREDEPAEVKSAKLISARLALYDESLPLVLTGDFNAPAGGGTYSNFSPLLKDASLVAAQKQGPEGTFHGFKGTPGRDRIDWILFRAPWRVTRMEVLTVNKEGRYPSDHFPVVAEFSLK